jgi:predicted metal-binding membrane protein
MGSLRAFTFVRAAWCAELMPKTAIEAMLERESAVVLAALVLLILLAWYAVLAGAGTGMDPVFMSGLWLSSAAAPAVGSGWTPGYWAIAYFMWTAMMVAMMLPSASPMVLLYARVVRQAETQGRGQKASASISAFAGGYIALWSVFSLLAVAAQWMLERTGALSVLMNSRSLSLSGALLIAAGIYQLTPFKTACLEQCRAPAVFIAAHWRRGALGGWRMGLEHGLYCLGCCAVLMLLLFVGGIMNLVWIAGLTLFIALEKLAPFGATAARAAAALLIAGGAALIVFG